MNSLPIKALAEPEADVRVFASALCGVITAIELPGRHPAMESQWHQERHAGTDHAGNGVFAKLVGMF